MIPEAGVVVVGRLKYVGGMEDDQQKGTGIYVKRRLI